MGKPYSMDLRERVVAAVKSGGMSRNRAAKQFGVAVSTAINWVRRLGETGSVAPGQDGRPQAEEDWRRASPLAAAAGQRARLHIAGAGGLFDRAWPQGRLSLGPGVRPRREPQLQKKSL